MFFSIQILIVSEALSNRQHGLGNLSKDVFERRTSTGSEAFFLFICLDAIKFSSLTFFSLSKRTDLWSQGTCMFVSKTFFAFCTPCAWVFFSTSLLWEFIHAKLLQLYNLKTRLAGEICPSDVNVNKSYSTKH